MAKPSPPSSPVLSIKRENSNNVGVLVEDKIETEYDADVCEFNPSKTTLAVGTYQLIKETHLGGSASSSSSSEVEEESSTARRRGRLHLYRLSKKRDSSCSISSKEEEEEEECSSRSISPSSSYLEEILHKEWPTGGILDVKWASTPLNGDENKSEDILAVADSTGHVSLMKFTDEPEKQLGTIQTFDLVPDNVLCLSMDLSRCDSSPSPIPTQIHVSHSDGSAGTLDVASGTYRRWPAHAYETWAVATHPPYGTVMTGGDDATWAVWDPRTATCVHRVRLDAGVTHLGAASVHAASGVVVGSYDATVRWYDVRCLRRATAVVQTSGGAWRCRWHPTRPWLAVAAMQGGCQVFECPGGQGNGHRWCLLGVCGMKF